MKKVLAIALSVLMCIGCFPLVSFAAEATDHLAEVPEGYVGVYTKDDLDYVRMNMSGKYILMNDIVFEDKDFEKGGDFYNSGKGWSPIGTSSTNFNGTFDGNGYAIKNLYINAPEQDYIGLFGCVSNATITRTSLINANIIGKESVGGIVGSSSRSTTVSYCNSHGTVIGINNVGGVVGNQYSDSASNPYQNYVNYCNNSANVSAKSNVGGIVGNSCSNCYYSYCGYSHILYCSNSGLITATDSNAGGVVGNSRGDYFYGHSRIEIYYCYNLGNVVSLSNAGGLIGKNEYTDAENCYSIGHVSATSDFGGCFSNAPDIITYCYYLDESVVNPTCLSGTAKSADQLRRATAYEQWDFTNVWTMEGREDYPYPELINIPLVLPGDFHEHDYKSEVTTPATHLKTGVMTYTCECGDSYTETIEKIAEHSYASEITTPVTHTSTGVMTYTCECGGSYTETIEKTAEHSYSSVVTDPTCTEQGYTTYTCACGDSYKSDYVTENGHTDGEWTVTKPATTTATGTKTQSCSVCGEALRTETIPMLPAKVYGVSVSDVSLDYKATATITPAVNADNGAKYTVSYSSSDPSVTNVDANGKVTATGTGNATITCTVKDTQGNTVTDTCEVKVSYNWWQWIIVIVLFGWIWY